ncbi:malonic semialdehyde reductase [Nocardia sp. NPDC060249]|uniref:malonic semialdehyde reductase n=1 Tax=Nocardia sp. NPDC060249 TaxID=3347082 RepID=UPI003651594D
MAATVSTEQLALDTAAQDLLFRTARTANTFTDEPVTDEQFRAIYELVKFGPTSMNQQPLRGVLVRSYQAKSRLVEAMTDRNKDKTAQAPLTVILGADLDFHDELPKLVPFMENPQNVFADPAVREKSATFNAALQLAYLIIGIRAAGLAAGPMVGFDADAIAREFFPDGRHTPLCVINIGKPGADAWMGRLPRLEYDEVFGTA